MHEVIDTVVSRKAPGVYVLDRSSDGSFTAAYIGRSESDLNGALHAHVGAYRFFKYAYCNGAQEAFEAQCELYHSQHPADHADHPANQSGWECPYCESSE